MTPPRAGTAGGEPGAPPAEVSGRPPDEAQLLLPGAPAAEKAPQTAARERSRARQLNARMIRRPWRRCAICKIWRAPEDRKAGVCGACLAIVEQWPVVWQIEIVLGMFPVAGKDVDALLYRRSDP